MFRLAIIFTVLCGSGLLNVPAAGGAAVTTATASAVDCSTSEIRTYTNPLNVPIADPFILHEGDTYYMYGTTDYGAPGFQVFTSPDLVRWTGAGLCFRPRASTWGARHFWAPEVIKIGSDFYLHYTSYSVRENKRNICVAKSSSPLGPFTDYSGPLFPDRSIIDSHIYHDEESGKYYIYASPENEPPSRILGCEISAGLDKLLTTPTACLTSEYGWEDLWIEGPLVHKHKGTYYMLFSGGAYWEADYALGYATAPSPLGPWTKNPANPFLQRSDDIDGPGHNGLAWSPDGTELFLVYHCHEGPWSINRLAALDRLQFDPVSSGPDVLRAPGAPTSTPQPLPSGAKPIPAVVSDEFTGAKLDQNQWEIFANNPKNWSFDGGCLTVRAGISDFWRRHDSGENVFLQRLPASGCDFAIETSVTMNATRINEQVFLTLWRDNNNYVTFAAGLQMGGELQFITTDESQGKANSSLWPNAIGWPVCLRIEKRGRTLKLFASKDGKNWQKAGRDLDLRHMTFTHVGLGAWSPGTDLRTPATFDYFRFQRL